MGDTGPCGPCSELLYDRGKKYSDAVSPIYDLSGERYLEFWNLVFMQYNRDENGKLLKLPKPSIDTGAGLERVVSLKMGVENIFVTDVLRSLISEIEKISKVKYIENSKNSPAFHVIADHIRTLAFAISDGIVPSNVERGYVLRKILRRAFRYGKYLNLTSPFLGKLLPSLISLMDDYDELKLNEEKCREIITLEEESFIKTLERGGNILNKIIFLAKEDNRMISGEEVFKLKDTYGFPIEEVLLIAKDENLQVDVNKFEKLEEEAKIKSKDASEKHMEKFDENFFADFAKKNSSEFLGHKKHEADCKVIALIEGKNFKNEISENELAIIILDKTPFYAEMGGQVGDCGFITTKDGIFKVEDAKSPYPGIIIHIGKVVKGSFLKNDIVKAKIDINRRKKIEANHSATHLLNYALTKVLGSHVKQAGSLVDENKLRFDFDHHKAMTKNEIREVERIVNKYVRDNIKVNDYEVSYDIAQKDPSIKQFFGEKYGEKVRVIEMNDAKELCGGAHTHFTGDIGYFRIFKESSISSGVRRIEAATGQKAEDIAYESDDVLEKIAYKLKSQPSKVEDAVSSTIDEMLSLKQSLKHFKNEEEKILLKSLQNSFEKINSFYVLLNEVNISPKDLNQFSERLVLNQKSKIVVLACKHDNKCQVVIKVSKDLADKNILANELIKEIYPIINGSGGGKKDSAQAGGKNPEKLDIAFEKIKEILKNKC